MKIVVKGNPYEYYEWVIVNDRGDPLAFSSTQYSRKSDAKRGAARFEQKLFNMYCNNGEYMFIEVLD